jgi:hypothetical protein
MLRWKIFLSLMIFAVFITTIQDADGLKVTMEHHQYELGDIIDINIINISNSTAIFNYEITNHYNVNFPERCITINDTSNIESGQTRTITVDTNCSGLDHIGIWTISSQLTYGGDLIDLLSTAEFEIVSKIFLCGLDDCSESKDFLDRNNIPQYFQNNTGWSQEKFKRSALYLFSDDFGKIVIPVTTEGIYSLDVETQKNHF